MTTGLLEGIVISLHGKVGLFSRRLLLEEKSTVLIVLGLILLHGLSRNGRIILSRITLAVVVAAVIIVVLSRPAWST